MELQSKTTGDTVEFRLIGSVDEAGARELGKAFQKLPDQGVGQVVLDFAAVTYIGSAGVGKLLLLYKKVALSGGRISIEHIPGHIHTLLAKDMNLGQLFTLKQG